MRKDVNGCGGKGYSPWIGNFGGVYWLAGHCIYHPFNFIGPGTAVMLAWIDNPSVGGPDIPPVAPYVPPQPEETNGAGVTR